MPDSSTLLYETYLAALPADRRDVVDAVWQDVRRAMPAGYTEHIGPKFLSFKADEEWYVALANQKNYISLHLVPVYCFPELDAKLTAAGPKLKRGKGCINFKRAEELPLAVIGEIIAAHSPESFRAHVLSIRQESKEVRAERRGK